MLASSQGQCARRLAGGAASLGAGVRWEYGGESMLALAADSDDSLKALNYILNAWEEAAENGISPETMAYAALYAALTDLVGTFGEGAVMKLVKELGPRGGKGGLTLGRRVQEQANGNREWAVGQGCL